MKSFSQFKEENSARSFLVIAEKEMSKSQMKRREEIAQAMDDEDFKKRYGKDWMSVKMATATKQAMKEESEEEVVEEYVEHWCAKHVYHDVFGEGVVVEGEHAVPDENGDIEWYTVEFPHGKETVFTEDVKVMHERMHGHMMKKKKKMSEEEEVTEMSSKEKMKKGLYNKEAKDVNWRPMHPQTRDYGPGYDEDEEDEEEEEKKPKQAQPMQKKKMGEAKLHPNQQQLDVHEPEKDELTAKDFEMLRKIKKARAK